MGIFLFTSLLFLLRAYNRLSKLLPVSEDEQAQGLARQRLAELIRQTPGESCASLSALIGRNHAYIQQYLRRGRPRWLALRDARLIAGRLGVPESLIAGGASPGQPRAGFGESAGPPVFVPCLDAGPGCALRATPFRRTRLAELAAAEPARLAMLTVEDDAMYPTLAPGDEVLLDLARRTPGREALFGIRLGGASEIRRIAADPVSGRLAVRTDNPLYADWPDCDPAGLEIVGRALWAGKRL